MGHDALVWHSRGQEFNSLQLHQIGNQNPRSSEDGRGFLRAFVLRGFDCDFYEHLHGEPATQPALRQSRQYDCGILRPSPMLRNPNSSSIFSNPNAFFPHPQQGHSAQGGTESKSYGITTPICRLLPYKIYALLFSLSSLLYVDNGSLFSASYMQVECKT